MTRATIGQNRLHQTQKNKAAAHGPPAQTAEKISIHADAYPALALYCCHAG
jgi:hypothetical protein